MSFEIQFFTMVASQGLGLAVATQLLLEPENTWVSWPVLIAVLVLAIASTIKVIRFVDGVNRRLGEMEKRLKAGDEEGEP